MNKKLLIMRVLTAIGLGALLSTIIVILILNPIKNTLISCLIYEKTGYKCATCGATRAVYHFFTFNLKTAFYYHAYFTALSPVIGYMIISLSVNVFVGKRVLPFPKHWYYWLAVFVVGLFGFAVVRNLVSVFY